MSHTVTITSLPDESTHEIGYQFGGTHDARCEFYKPCTREWHRHPTSEDVQDEGEWSTKRAGHHAYLDGTWMVPADPDKDGCALRFVFEGWSAAETLEHLEVGETRDVECQWDGDYWELNVHPKPSEAGSGGSDG